MLPGESVGHRPRLDTPNATKGHSQPAFSKRESRRLEIARRTENAKRTGILIGKTVQPSNSQSQIQARRTAQLDNSRSEIGSQRTKTSKSHPSKMFRLERTPTDCFQQLTRILNEPMFRLERANRSRISDRPRRKTKQKNDQSKHRPHAPVRIQRFPAIHQRRMTEKPRADHQQTSPHDPTNPKKIPPNSKQAHDQNNRSNTKRNPPMPPASQTIKNVPAIQLPGRQQIQRRDKKPNPSRPPHRMQKNIPSRSIRAQDRDQKLHQRRIPKSQSRRISQPHTGHDLRIRNRENQRRHSENKSDHRPRQSHIKKRLASWNRRANPNERPKRSQNRRRRNEIRISNVNSILPASEVVTKFMCKQDAKQREREGNSKRQQLRMLKRSRHRNEWIFVTRKRLAILRIRNRKFGANRQGRNHSEEKKNQRRPDWPAARLSQNNFCNRRILKLDNFSRHMTVPVSGATHRKEVTNREYEIP
jgi:hypothetical protein